MLTLSPVLPRSIRFSIAQVDAALRAHHRATRRRYNGSRAARRARRDGERGAARGRPARTASSPTSASTTSSSAACTPTCVDLQRQCYRIGEPSRRSSSPTAPLTAEEVHRREVPHPPPHGLRATPRPVFESFNEVRLRPDGRATTQTLLDFDLAIDPPATVIAFRDYYGNAVHDFGIPYLHEHLDDRGDERRRHPRRARTSRWPARATARPTPRRRWRALRGGRRLRRRASPSSSGRAPTSCSTTPRRELARDARGRRPGGDRLALPARGRPTCSERLAYRVGATTVALASPRCSPAAAASARTSPTC